MDALGLRVPVVDRRPMPVARRQLMMRSLKKESPAFRPGYSANKEILP
jgi:hypothetical protein